jgi:hypothetical protein
MNLLLLVLLALPFGCLALLSLLAFLSVVAIAGAIHAVGTIKTALLCIGGRPPGDGGEDPWHGMVGEAHPLDYVDGQHLPGSARVRLE